MRRPDRCHLDDLAMDELDMVTLGQNPGLDHAQVLAHAPETPLALDFDRHGHLHSRVLSEAQVKTYRSGYTSARGYHGPVPVLTRYAVVVAIWITLGISSGLY